MRLKNQVAVITGAGAGIGKSVALRYAAEGAQVVVAEVNADTGRATAQEIHASRHHIRVNAIVPGCMDTPMNAVRLSDEKMRQKRIDMTPYGRLGTGEDVAGLAVFLASHEADYCVGGFYAVDGGMMAI
jgi:NAD(P)-dependent dehydrogenase (short-subunit alcohol dehydrogenase family)